MPSTIKVMIKGLNKVMEFPSATALPDIEKAIKVNWSQVEEMSGLPMDTASRMARAEHLGFDTERVFTHGSSDEVISKIRKADGDPFNKFDGLFTSEGDVSEFGGKFQHSLVTKGPVADAGDVDLDFDKSMEFIKKEFPDADEDELEDLYSIIAEDKNVFDMSENPLDRHGFDDLGEASWEGQRLRGQMAKEQGFDAISMSDEFGESFLVPAGSKARNINAAFNPAKQESANLLAGGAAAAVGIGLAGQSEESEAGVVGSIAKEMKRLHPNIKSFITESDGVATLQKVVVDEASRGAGQGSKFMDDFLRLADEKGSTTALTPSADFGGNKKRLEGFYEGFGFKPNKGRNKDFSISETLIRSPKTSGSALAALAAGQAQANTARVDMPSDVTANSILLDQSNIPSIFKPSLGGIESPVSPSFINRAGAELKNLEFPLVGNPLEGVADYLENFGFPDTAEERLKRAAMAGLDVI